MIDQLSRNIYLYVHIKYLLFIFCDEKYFTKIFETATKTKQVHFEKKFDEGINFNINI